jgi:hypothetical protein
MHKKMQKEMMETGKDVAAVHGSKDERDGDEAAAQQRAAAHARLLMQNQVQQPEQQQPEQQQFQPQMHLQLAGSGATAASGEKLERVERGGVERAAAADGGRVDSASHCVASVHDVHDVSAGAAHAECAAASSVEGVRSDLVQHDEGRPRDEGACSSSMVHEERTAGSGDAREGREGDERE